MPGQEITASEAFVAQLTNDGCCDNGLVRPFHKVGHGDAWLHGGVVVCRIVRHVGAGCTDRRRRVGLWSTAHGRMQGEAVRSQDWKAANLVGGYVNLFGENACVPSGQFLWWCSHKEVKIYSGCGEPVWMLSLPYVFQIVRPHECDSRQSTQLSFPGRPPLATSDLTSLRSEEWRTHRPVKAHIASAWSLPPG